MSNFRKALLCTAIPIVVVALISIVPPMWFVWFVATSFAGIAFLIGIILLFVKEYRQIAAGIFAGIGIIALGATCFAINEELNHMM